jgi:hypothetical protein
VYTHVWHRGLIFLAWLFAVWISAARVRMTPAILTPLAAVIVVQGYWTVAAVSYDWTSPYSGSREAANYLKSSGISRDRIFAIGYACTAIQPYFGENRFGNIGSGAPSPSYWDWSRRNHVNEAGERLDALRPEYVIIGAKYPYERGIWTRQVKRSGYEFVRRFEGNLFWEDDVLEPEAFDLYRRHVP